MEKKARIRELLRWLCSSNVRVQLILCYLIIKTWLITKTIFAFSENSHTFIRIVEPKFLTSHEMEKTQWTTT